jgi:predicted small integral membrane protein
MTMGLEWMYWTRPTATFFILISLALVGMLIWELVSPTVERKGIVMVPTTRGTRFFLGLLGSAYITLAWIGFTDWNLYYVIPVLIGFIAFMLRYG